MNRNDLLPPNLRVVDDLEPADESVVDLELAGAALVGAGAVALGAGLAIWWWTR